MISVALAAEIAAILFAGLAIFQAALALGAPLAAYAWGGAHEGVLPDRLRMGSALSAPLLVALGAMVLVRARVIYPDWSGELSIAIWVVFLFLVINTSANFRSQSARERRVMFPLALILTLLVGYVALNAG